MVKIILVPGLLCTEHLFAKQISYLEDINDAVDVVIADTRGMISINAMAERILIENQSPFIIAGLSMGGYVAQMIAHLAPDRVQAVGLFSTSSRADTPERKEQRQALINLSKLGKFKCVTPRLLPHLLSPEALKNLSLVEIIMQMAADIGQQNFTYQQ